MLEKAMAELASKDVIQNAMGVMGPWHIVICTVVSLVKFSVAWHQLSIVFLAPPTNHTCISPKSATNESMLMKCYVNVGNGTMEPCTEFKYDKRIFKDTIRSEWDLVCDKEHLVNLVQACTMFGVLIGNFLFSTLADRIGRKIPFMIAIALQSSAGFISALVPWYELFLFFKFLAALATGGVMLISYVIIMEIVGIEWRSPVAVLYHIPFTLGYILSPLISYLTRRWSTYQMAISLPSMVLLSCYWIIPESPRWLLAVGKFSKAEEVLIKAASKNQMPIENVRTAIETYQANAKARCKQPKANHNMTHLFRTPNLRKKTIYICACWFVCGSCFFGIAQYMGHLEGDIFVNIAVGAAAELPFTLVALFLISRVSRLRILMGANLVSGTSLLLIPLISNPTARVALSTIGNAGITLCFTAVYLYSSEAFPTVVRNIGLGMGSISARVGSTIAPYIVALGKIEPLLPPVILGIGPIIAALLCLLLPETMNCELPETIEDGENFGKKKKPEVTTK